MVEKKIEERNIIAGSVIFPCPQCGKSKINRTLEEKKLGTKYICPMCSFEGPN